MRFIDRIGEYLNQIAAELYEIRGKIDGIDWGHDCDCEFCEHEGEDADPKADEKAASLDKEYKDLLKLRKQLMDYKERR